MNLLLVVYDIRLSSLLRGGDGIGGPGDDIKGETSSRRSGLGSGLPTVSWLLAGLCWPCLLPALAACQLYDRYMQKLHKQHTKEPLCLVQQQRLFS
ncbi:hypothetical protein THAOC_30886 [Thalassiosira oceanica]|uniref:Uncharacterized protein n=1 Tax=Thalassiosira oceanica TaxID=159749 RepID=K0RU66_THAOC|nr:hypothetical protein THAOC_30886 [Thalassiosira oceanica]|eukprot:EJK50167.1 hypothetical protein THAOC_30886 [Thalassiosira oceanica]